MSANSLVTFSFSAPAVVGRRWKGIDEVLDKSVLV
jgi:hypothetical protein